MEEIEDDRRIHCSKCECCTPQLLRPEDIGCFCEELGVEIGAHETVSACSYYIPKDDNGKEQQ